MRIYIISLILLFNVLHLDAQHFDVGVKAGGSNYLGDLTPSGLWTSLGDTHASVGAFARYNIMGWFGIRGGLNYGKISASDRNADPTSQRVFRNLSFRSNILELELTTEINLFRYEAYNLRRPFSPYIFGGIAVFRFNPQANYKGKWYDLQPLGTEGQGLKGYSNKYHLTQFFDTTGGWPQVYSK